MTSSWIPTFPFSFSVPRPFTTSRPGEPTPSEAGGSSTSPPLVASNSRSLRFPSPPLRGTDTLSVLDDSPNGSKRSRELSNASEETDGEPDRKKRKRGIVGTVLETALDAAVFSTALGYSAYQLWKNPPTKDDVDALAQRKRQLMLEDRPHSSNSTIAEAPPPYSEQSTHESRQAPGPSSSTSRHSTLPASPSQIPRRVRHAHESRPRLSARTSTSSPSPSTPSSLTIDNRPISETFRTALDWTPRDPLANLPSVPLPEFQPYSSPKFNHSFDPQLVSADQDIQEAEEDLEEDEEMKAVSDRLKNLIETGREALASRPREWSVNSSTTSSDSTSSPSPSRSRLSTASSIPTVSASPRKPSPLSQFSSRFESLLPAPSAQPKSLSPRHSLPAQSSSSSQHHSSPSGHSRRKSLDSRIPTSTSTLHNPSSPRSSTSISRTRGHRPTQSYSGGAGGGISSSQSLGTLNEGDDGKVVANEFEKVLQQARKSRASFGRE